MEPRIQYATTSDGVSIAFQTIGQGTPPLVRLPSMLPDLRMGWQILDFRRGTERLAENRMLVKYDGRGRGLSDRNVTSFTLDSLVLDLTAVVDHLSLERFAMVAVLDAGPPAIAYAVAHPGRVTCLVLLNAYSSGACLWGAPRAKGVRAMREAGGASPPTLSPALVGHREMMQPSGDAKGREVPREHERIPRETLKQHGGAEVKT